MPLIKHEDTILAKKTLEEIPRGAKWGQCNCGTTTRLHISDTEWVCPQCQIRNVWRKDTAPVPASRTFESGATRSNDPDRVDWVKMISLPALFEYAEYMSKHRKQADGNIRDFDNWKKGIPPSEIVESLVRHVLDLAALESGEEPMRPCTPRETCCAILFNAFAYLHELKKK